VTTISTNPTRAQLLERKSEINVVIDDPKWEQRAIGTGDREGGRPSLDALDAQPGARLISR
jgi:hypothetical protein